MLALALALGRNALAQAAGFELTWRAPPGCPARAEVERELESALSRLRWRGPLHVAGEVQALEEARFRLRVRVLHAGQIGERALPLADCSGAARAAALLAALSIESPSEQAAAPQGETRMTKLTPSFTAGIGPHLVLGIAPELSAGAGVSVTYSAHFWRIAWRGAAFAPSRHALPESQAGGSFQLLTAGLFGCAGRGTAPLALYGCLGGRYDRLRGTGFGADATASAATLIGSAAVGVTAEWVLSRRFRLRGDFEAAYALGRARFVIENLSPAVHEVEGLRSELGLELAVTF
jgi:hypothetical protein